MRPPAPDGEGDGLDLIVDRLSCPHCGDRMHRESRTLRCASGHAFDIARQGYVALLTGGRRATTADTAEMVAARERFLGTGHYAPVAAALVEAVPVGVDGLCVDIAGGTGYYLGAVLDARPSVTGVTVDLSPPALRRAARAHPRAAAVAGDAWARLPLLDDAASVAMSVFGPRNGGDIARILRHDGVLVTVTPTERHLAELVGPLGLISVGADKSDRLDRRLAAFDRIGTRAREYVVRLGRDEVEDLVLMGPSAYHLDRGVLAARVGGLPDPVSVTVSVEVSRHRPRRGSGDGSHNGSG